MTGTRSSTPLRTHDRFVVTSHDNPDGDALGSLLATHLALEALGKDSVMVLGGREPASRRVRLPPARGARAAPRGAGRRRGSRPRRRRLRAGEPHRRVAAARRGADRRHRPSPRQHALRRRQPRRRGRLVDRRGARRHLPRARGRPHARDRRGALHRDRDRHGPVPVLEHDARRRCGSRPSSSRRART